MKLEPKRDFGGQGRLRNHGSLDKASDDFLLQLCGTGSTTAFDAVVSRYWGPLVGYCSRIVGPSDAEDAVQQVFTRAAAAFRDDRCPNQLKPWLYRVAHNCSIDMLRRAEPEHNSLNEEHKDLAVTASNQDARERLGAAVEAIKQLPERQRRVVVLHEFEGRSYNEISAELETSPAMVSKLMQKARAKVRAAAGALFPAPALRWLQSLKGADVQRIGEVGATGGGSVGLATKLVIVLVAIGITGVGAATQIERSNEAPSKQSRLVAQSAVGAGDESGKSASTATSRSLGPNANGSVPAGSVPVAAAGDRKSGRPGQHRAESASNGADRTLRDHDSSLRSTSKGVTNSKPAPDKASNHTTPPTDSDGAADDQALTRAERKQRWLAERKQRTLQRTARMRDQHQRRADSRREAYAERRQARQEANRQRAESRKQVNEQRQQVRQQANQERASGREQANQQRQQERQRVGQERQQARQQAGQQRQQARQEANEQRQQARQQASQQRQQARQQANQQRAQARQRANQQRAQERQAANEQRAQARQQAAQP